ncbi:MAG: transposase [Blastocatellales bacterium]|nr:transposase [Blastocatellales bacterium]MCW5971687.1 transposase [Blastocatellales bacterium]
MTSAFEDFLNQQASVIRAHWHRVYAADLEPTLVAPPPDIERVVPPTESEYMRSRSCQFKRQQWHAERRARYEQIQELKRQGKNVRQISMMLGGSYSQTRSHYYASEYQVIHRQAHGSQVERYDEYLRRRWAEGCDNAQQLHREIAAQGYQGSRVTVRRYVYPWRKADAAAQGCPLPAQAIRPPKRRVPNVRECVWFLLKPETKLTEEEKLSREQLLTIEPINRALPLVQEFRELLAAGKVDQFDEWIQKAEKTEGSPFKGFLHGVRRDSEAVRNAFRSPWSNGQTEGQVNRLKFIKRQMFGRANFDLLRIRVLSEI